MGKHHRKKADAAVKQSLNPKHEGGGEQIGHCRCYGNRARIAHIPGRLHPQPRSIHWQMSTTAHERDRGTLATAATRHGSTAVEAISVTPGQIRAHSQRTSTATACSATPLSARKGTDR